MADKVLIAEDDVASRIILRKSLELAGFEVQETRDGAEARAAYTTGAFAAVLTDWMMPEIDGLELIEYIRRVDSDPPPLLMVTALADDESRRLALHSGADGFVGKPYTPSQVRDEIMRCLATHHEKPSVDPPPAPVVRAPTADGDLGVIVIASSTGGPPAVGAVLAELSPMPNVALLLVQHGPAWMLENWAESLDKSTSFPCRLAEDGARIEPGSLSLAPGGRHMEIDRRGQRLRLTDGPEEHFLKPAADPTFRSAAAAFGSRTLGVVLTGMGRDGTDGCAHVAAAGGLVLIQEPATATAPSMPRSVREAGVPHESFPLQEIAEAIRTRARRMAAGRDGGRRPSGGVDRPAAPGAP